jgi:copper transporter 1
MMDTEHGGCRASNMLWNWDTIDTCLISEQWHIRSTGMFAGACIAVVMLTLSLEFFRRLAKEYDRKITREHQEGLAAVMASATNSTTGSPVRDDKGARERRSQALDGLGVRIGEIKDGEVKERFRPSLGQQLIRGLLHTIQFTVAYFIML